MEKQLVLGMKSAVSFEAYAADEVERKLIFAIKVIRILNKDYKNKEATKAANELSAEINYA